MKKIISGADAKPNQTILEQRSGADTAGQRAISEDATRVLSSDMLLKRAAEALTRTVINKALAGDALSLRQCLNRLETLRRDKYLSFELPNIDGPEDFPKITLALLRAVAAREIIPAEAAALAKLVDVHMRAIELADISERVRHLEELKAID